MLHNREKRLAGEVVVPETAERNGQRLKAVPVKGERNAPVSSQGETDLPEYLCAVGTVIGR